MPASEHDRLVKTLLGRPELAAEFFRAFLPDSITRALELDRLHRLPQTFVSKEQRQFEVDLLFRVELNGESAMALILLEHQSHAPRFMALRIFEYLGRIWSWWANDHPGSPVLPRILPVVLYHGRKPWSAPRRLSSLFASREPAWEGSPEVGYWVSDLGQIPDEDLLARVPPTGDLVALALFFLKHGRSLGITQRVHELRTPLSRLFARIDGHEDLIVMVNYLTRITPPGRIEPLVAELIRVGANQMVKNFISAQDAWHAQGVQRGMEQGIEQGIEKGIERGRRMEREQVLLGILEKRFGLLPCTVRERIETAHAPELETWIYQALSAASLDGVFA